MYLLITVKDQETAQNRLLRRCGEMTTLLSVAVTGSPCALFSRRKRAKAVGVKLPDYPTRLASTKDVQMT